MAGTEDCLQLTNDHGELFSGCRVSFIVEVRRFAICQPLICLLGTRNTSNMLGWRILQCGLIFICVLVVYALFQLFPIIRRYGISTMVQNHFFRARKIQSFLVCIGRVFSHCSQKQVGSNMLQVLLCSVREFRYLASNRRFQHIKTPLVQNSETSAPSCTITSLIDKKCKNQLMWF